MTKNNLAKRGILKPPECAFCNETESINHLFFDCALAGLVRQVGACAFALPRTPSNLNDLVGAWIKRFPIE